MKQTLKTTETREMGATAGWIHYLELLEAARERWQLNQGVHCSKAKLPHEQSCSPTAVAAAAAMEHTKRMMDIYRRPIVVTKDVCKREGTREGAGGSRASTSSLKEQSSRGLYDAEEGQQLGQLFTLGGCAVLCLVCGVFPAACYRSLGIVTHACHKNNNFCNVFTPLAWVLKLDITSKLLDMSWHLARCGHNIFYDRKL